MASQGPLLVGSGVNVADTGQVEWTNPGRITAEDGLAADVTLLVGEASDQLAGTNCGFSVPTGATIDGIIVELNDLTETGADVIHSLWLTKDGTAAAGDEKTPIAAAGWASYGSASDLWGATVTPTEVNASTFGLLLQSLNDSLSARTISNDAARLTVHYTAPVTIPQLGVFDPLLVPKAWF